MLRGFSTLEILLALTIMMTTLSAIVLVELGSPNALANGRKEIEAARVASTILDSAFAIGLSNFAAIGSLASTTIDNSTVSLSVKNLPDGFTKYLTSTAEWVDIEGTARFQILHALITDFADVTQSPCSNVLAGDWTHPHIQTFTFAVGDLLPTGSSAANPVSVLAVSSSTLIAGIGTTTAKSDATLLIFDISSTTRPIYLSSVDNATSTKQGVSSVALSGNYLYAANANKSNFGTCKQGPACSQLQIFDITNPTAPIDTKNFELSTTSGAFATGSGGQSIGKSIAYANGFIYLGLSKTGSASGEEFNIIDIHNPRTPIWLGGFPVGRTINQIVIRGTRAYLATDDSTRELIVLDIRDPSNISLVGSYDAPGAPGFGYGNDVDVENTTLALGRTYTPNGPEVSMLSIASDTPQLLSSETIASTLNPTTVQSVLLRDFLLLVLTNSVLEFFDIRNPANPIPYGNSLSLPIGSLGTAMACRDNAVYISSVSANQAGYLTILTGS